jgi:hypothetical protein
MNANEHRPVARLLDPQGHDVTPLAWEEARARILEVKTLVKPGGRGGT